jgi:hypothetical protein
MSKYHYLKNNRAIAVTSSDSLDSLSKPLPVFDNKAEFREWCADENTDHCFYSMCEGDNPSLRVGVDNPVNMIYGFVADYDGGIVDWATVDDVLKARADTAPMPTWRSRTFSNGIRLVWEFQNPLPIAPDLAPVFLKRFSDHVRASMLMGGFDRTSLKPTQYFELGRDWARIGDPVPNTVIHTVLLKAANEVPITTTDTSIPIEEIAAEVDKRYPNRWKGDFAVGTRGPLFWIDDGIDRVGCQVREDGMICYSDRAGKGFVSWRELFGKKFVEQYEEQKLGTLLDQYWFNGKSFYKMLGNIPVAIPKEQLVLELRRAGFSTKLKKGQTISEVEQAILCISNDNRVDEVAPVVFSGERMVKFNGRKILNNCYAKPVQPAADGDPSYWPWLEGFMTPFFSKDDHGNETLPYFYAWFQRLYRAVLEHRMDQGQLLILLGHTGHGKTLLTNKIVGSAVGGFSDASAYLSGNTAFNKDLCGSAAWVIDDQTAAATYADQRKFVELTKRCVANPRLEYHAKYADAVPLPWAGRVMMSLNLDAQSLAALPTLDSSNRDKIIALRVSAAHKPKFGSNEIVEKTVKGELPHFLRWLLDWSPPTTVLDTSRFGVKTYIDPFIEAAAYDNSSRSAIAEMVEFFAKKVREYLGQDKWRGTLTEFTVTLHEANGGRSVGNSNSLEFVRRGMTVLEEVSAHNKAIRPVRSRGHGGGKLWEIDLSQKYDIDQGEPFTD